ncbi:hypothetical protein WOSG25_030750 [Weissella oryzae SG25]|uniref:DUF4811 domain-containing protein n=1 Tax=Weissella oryzae (strain DSM 25784 / JCM 18191 / LMG 30913 / SG25) TaxID=1329250 RepID=A0A069CTA5_WEIOS|nr:DUF4811 domain-containing protein [Weissella oryzae]GAK30478.1 hypothetical protein WOSG25_030750 [Weissella oryzae SG25]
MILIIMLILAILTFVSWAFIKKTNLRITLGTISMVLLFVTVGALNLNIAHHFGMEKVTTSKKSAVYSASPASPAGMLIAQRLGTKADNYVLVYSASATAKKPTTFGVPDKSHITTAVKERTTYRLADVDDASAKTVTVRWEWKNNFYKLLFEVGGQGGELVSRVKTVTVPKATWVVMTPQEAKTMQAQQAQAQSNPAAAAAQQSQMKMAVEAKVAAYMQAHPRAQQSEIQAATKTATAEAIKHSLAQ